MTSVLTRGLAAGAAGTAALNAVTYADMALRGRPASRVPQQTVDALTGAVGLEVPGRGRPRESRTTALGELSGFVNGTLVALVGSVLRQAGVRPGPVTGSVVAGAAAMVATDVPVGLLGVSDPRTWSAGDWIGDAVPHLAYGAAVHAVLRALQADTAPVRAGGPPAAPARAGLVLRSAALGLASGGRSSLALAVPLFAAAARPRAGGPPRPASLAVAGTAVVAEVVADKLPQTPSRLAPPGLLPRAVGSGAGALALARAEDATAAVPVVAGVLGGLLGSWAGSAWRARAADRGTEDWRAALVEDAVALGLAALVAVTGRRV